MLIMLLAHSLFNFSLLYRHRDLVRGLLLGTYGLLLLGEGWHLRLRFHVEVLNQVCILSRW